MSLLGNPFVSSTYTNSQMLHLIQNMLINYSDHDSCDQAQLLVKLSFKHLLFKLGCFEVFGFIFRNENVFQRN